MTGIKTLFFDVGGVCLTNGWDHIEREKAAEIFNYDFKLSEQRHVKLANKFECGHVSLDDYLDKTIFFQEQNFSKEDFFEFMKEQSQPHPEVIALLKKIRSQGKYRMATINNESLELNQHRIQHFKLFECFDNFFSSCFLGVLKPDCAIFQKALWVTQQNPAECLFVDDRAENIAAAQSCGLQAVQLHSPNDLPKILQEKGIKY